MKTVIGVGIILCRREARDCVESKWRKGKESVCMRALVCVNCINICDGLRIITGHSAFLNRSVWYGVYILTVGSV